MAILEMIPPEYWRQLRDELNAIDWRQLDRQQKREAAAAAREPDEAARAEVQELARQRRRERQRVYQAKYRAEHREEIRAYHRARNARIKADRETAQKSPESNEPQ